MTPDTERWRRSGRNYTGRYSSEYGLTTLLVEDLQLDARESWEKRYQAEPKKTHSVLVYKGLWTVAAQLKIDYEAGRLG